ncbi:MFS transporter [Candidatus Izemoplasma sp. B36]|uniref:MFS transporter n=1 Tax=Candidatus Izemoplasma sp. B36 TaxID=3242468 RepID=UPI0035591F99
MLKSKFIKDKNFVLLFFGNLVSGVGSRIHGFGISLFLLDLTGKATSTATYLAIWTFIIFIFGPIAATFTDRMKKKAKVLVFTDYSRGISYLLTALFVFIGLRTNNTTLTTITIYVSVLLIGIQTAFFSPAVTSLIPEIVEKDELVSASSVMQITRSIQNIAGLLFGALLYVKFGIVVLMIINATSFIVSGFSEMFIKSESKHITEDFVKPTSIKETFTGIFKDLKGAIVYLFKGGKPVLVIAFIILISATLVSPWFAIGEPFMFKEYFNFNNFEPEYLLASSNFFNSLGVILMSLVVAQIAAKFKIYQLIRVGGFLFILIGVSYFFIVKAFDTRMIVENSFIFLFVGASFIGGMVNAIINAPLSASLQKYIDPKMLGKVSTFLDSIGGMLFPISALIVGYLLDHTGLYEPLFLMIFAMVLITLVAYRSKELKKLA